jgi:hypothetical protein
MTTLEYLGALLDESQMEQALGDKNLAAKYSDRAQRVRQGLYTKCWDPQRKLIADNPGKTSYSQQANSLAVLYDVVPSKEQKGVLERILMIAPGTAPDGVLSSSYYFRFYLARALEHAGMGDDYLASLKPWRELLPLHFSTWPETPGETRSDSHAWSAHPAFDLMTLVAGIEPASPGFASVRMAPHLGELGYVHASFPHTKGAIVVHLKRKGAGIHGTIHVPESLPASLLWKGKESPLHAGENNIDLP